MRERTVGATVEGRVRGGLVWAAGREEDWSGALAPLGQLDEGLAVDGPGRGVLADGASPVETAWRRRRQEAGLASQGHGQLELLEVLEPGSAVAGVQQDLQERSVGDAMTAEVFTCAKSDSVDFLMARMTEHRIRHIPVVEADRLAGLVSIGDVVKRRVEELEVEAQQLTEYIQTGR